MIGAIVPEAASALRYSIQFLGARMATNGRKGALQGANRCSIGAQNYISIL